VKGGKSKKLFAWVSRFDSGLRARRELHAIFGDRGGGTPQKSSLARPQYPLAKIV